MTSKFSTEMRQGGAWSRVGNSGGFNYIKAPENGKRPHEYIRDGRRVRAVMIMQKGTQGTMTWKPFDKWQQTTITTGDGNWISYTSNDACGKTAYKSRYTQSPGEWNVYVSKKTYDPNPGFFIEGYSRDRLASFAGTTFTFGIISEDYDGFTEDGCAAPGEEQPIKEEDFLMSVTYETERNSRGSFASYTLTQKDEWGNKRVNKVTPTQGALQGALRAKMKPETVWCSQVR